MGSASYPSSLGSSIQTAELDDASVTTAKIADGAVTAAKLVEAAGTQSGVYMPVSTTITDYTTPSACVSSSTGVIGGLVGSVATASASGTWSITIPTTLTNCTDTDEATGNSAGGNANTGAWGYIELDYGSLKTIDGSSIKFNISRSGGTNNSCNHTLEGWNGSAWVTLNTPTPNTGTFTTILTFTSGSYSKLRMGVHPSAANPCTVHLTIYYMHLGRAGIAANAFDTNTATDVLTAATANQDVYVDMASALNLTGIAIYGSANMTETEITIRTSADAITWTVLRKITVTNIIAAQWNYIVFNAVNARYVDLYGNSGSALAVGAGEIKVRTNTDSQITVGSRNKVIDNDDATLTLAGVAA